MYSTWQRKGNSSLSDEEYVFLGKKILLHSTLY